MTQYLGENMELNNNLTLNKISTWSSDELMGEKISNIINKHTFDILYSIEGIVTSDNDNDIQVNDKIKEFVKIGVNLNIDLIKKYIKEYEKLSQLYNKMLSSGINYTDIDNNKLYNIIFTNLVVGILDNLFEKIKSNRSATLFNNIFDTLKLYIPQSEVKTDEPKTQKPKTMKKQLSNKDDLLNSFMDQEELYDDVNEEQKEEILDDLVEQEDQEDQDYDEELVQYDLETQEMFDELF